MTRTARASGRTTQTVRATLREPLRRERERNEGSRPFSFAARHATLRRATSSSVIRRTKNLRERQPDEDVVVAERRLDLRRRAELDKREPKKRPPPLRQRHMAVTS